MHGVVVLAIFGFCLVLAHAVAARRPLVAVLAVVAGAGWAATLYPSRNVVFGALILAGALWALAGLRSTQPVTALLAGAAVILAAAAASTSAAVAKDGVLAWERWNPGGSLGGAGLRRYVWDAQYGGIQFPKKERTVLRITGPKRGALLAGDDARSVRLRPLAREPDSALDRPRRGRLPDDPLLPTRSLDRQHLGAARRWRSARSGTAPGRRRAARRLEAPQLGGVFHFSGGVVRVDQRPRARAALHRLELRARPEPAELARRRAGYPPGRSSGSSTSGARASQPFGTAGRDARVERALRRRALLALWPYRSSGTGASGCARARGRRTERSWRSRPGCAHRRLHLRRAPPAGRQVCRRSPTSSPRARAATASTSPARWR